MGLPSILAQHHSNDPANRMGKCAGLETRSAVLVVMETNPVNKGSISNNFAGIGAVTREMIDKRACELAILSGRAADEVTDADFEQATRELNGETDLDNDEVVLESLPESDRWNPNPGSAGKQSQELPNEDEDDEGRSETTQLVEGGVREAEHDQMVQAEETAQDKARRGS
jgi:hypothetical protein